MIIQLIIGLPGSGKSFYLNSLPDDLWFKIDDPKNLDFPYTGKNLAIADPNFIFQNILEKAKAKLINFYGLIDIQEIYFENNPVKCINNIKYRNDNRKTTNFIKQFSKFYEPPLNSITIWQNQTNGDMND